MQTLSVSQFLDLVNETLQLIPSQEFTVEGEVSDFRIAQGKWISFDLKDEKQEAVLKCFMAVWQMKTPIENGMRVRANGYPKVYERFGTFKLNAREVEPVGEGALARAYVLLKQKLENEGLFDASRKRPLPRFVLRVGLITSRDAAAYGDFLRILNNRWRGVVIEHAQVHVQGREAVAEIVGAFDMFNHLQADKPDVLVLTRGGGGLEDLHAFNDELVARAVFSSTIPVVVAVGHERDESLCDFVADIRASTPSNAAEFVVPSRTDVLYEIDTMMVFIDGKIRDRLLALDHVLDRASSLSRWFEKIAQKITYFERLLRELDPKRVLARGFSIVRDGDRIVTDASTLGQGASINVQFAAGFLDAQIKTVYDNKKIN